MRQNFGLLLPAVCAVLFLLALVVSRTRVDETIEDLGIEAQDIPLSEEGRRLLADVDAEALARYKADPKGFRHHPSYYSDSYVRRARAPVDTFGSWTLVDTKRSTRPANDFYTKYPSRDVPWEDFPDTAWQKDEEYLPKFLEEGIALAERALEAILTEYGFGKDQDSRDFSQRIKLLGAQVEKTEPGAVILNGDSYKGLVRRILHAIVTEDTFTFAMSGHSAAAGTYGV